jgi:SecD/SecF fusion protein
LQQQRPVQEYGNLLDAAGTNDLRRYFPFYASKKTLENPNTEVLNRLQRAAAGKIKLGLDLRGGTSFVLSMDTSKLEHASDATLALENAVEVLRKRVDNLGVAEPVIQPQGTDRILVQLPGLSQEARDQALRNIQRAAYLEFRMVHPESERLLQQGVVEPGYEVLRRIETDDKGKETVETVLVKKRAEMDGSGIANSMVVRGTLGEPQIDFSLNSDGAKRSFWTENCTRPR